MTAPGLIPACTEAVKALKSSQPTNSSNRRGSSCSCDTSNDRSEAFAAYEAASHSERGRRQAAGHCPTQHPTLQFPMSRAIAAVLFENRLNAQKKAEPLGTGLEPRRPAIRGLRDGC